MHRKSLSELDFSRFTEMKILFWKLFENNSANYLYKEHILEAIITY